ncbi:VWA domain-containing protein [Corynebacterium imitans]|uniref:vWA domain-containing protein n=1 Tax=Corynebacterium imitans TaxID=156978 RepID=UPI00254E4C6D|nr:vWA domain-containing protein [Corynebacterium imitans]MDK8307386.1 VWA domain-containing protein [Corynebacterium imitans]MDK8637255.1 VWA domain-containing protein [Corynebacterium imitans]MDK8772569.1 VWA domain-containing protein [Corynebacterium imitans]
MARHSNGKNNYALSGGAIAVLVALLLIVALVLWLIFGRGESSEEAAGGECVSGNLELPVAASDAGVGHAVVDAYAETKPVVRDYCVEPVLVDNVADAAVYVAPDTPLTHKTIEDAGRSAAVSDPEVVAEQQVGIAGEKAAELGEVDLSAVRFPTGEQPSASAVVASKLAGEDAGRAATALKEQRVDSHEQTPDTFVATAEDATPEGLVFTPVDAAVQFAAIPLNAGEQTDENQSRAGQDFARTQAKEGVGELPAVDEAVWAAAFDAAPAEQAPQQKEDTAQEAGEVAHTLFLLDTSDAMAPFIQPAKDAIGEAAGNVAAQEKMVGLWNYSSPLNEGVTRGYRVNVALTPSAEEVDVAVHRFLTGGVPQTREALTAAASASAGGAEPVRIVLVTTGTADAGEDVEGTAFAESLQQYLDQGVEIAVVHVGDGAKDAGVERVAATQAQASTPEELPAALATAVGTK